MNKFNKTNNLYLISIPPKTNAISECEFIGIKIINSQNEIKSIIRNIIFDKGFGEVQTIEIYSLQKEKSFKILSSDYENCEKIFNNESDFSLIEDFLSFIENQFLKKIKFIS